jgi:hypothetical protein
LLLALFSTLFRAAADMIGARWAFVKGWMHIDNANVYFDHPYHAPFDHALAIDFTCEADGGTERVAVELSAVCFDKPLFLFELISGNKSQPTE